MPNIVPDEMYNTQILHSEDDILACINSLFPAKHHSMPLGRGDDCAVLTTPQEICVSTDIFLEDVHFRRSYFTPEEIGHKALAVNISDIAAMGAKPLAFSMGLMLPKGVERGYLERLMQGMADLAKRYDLALSGGDISRSASLGFSITIYGTTPEQNGTFLRRGVCHEGDIVFVLGGLGLARVGLLSLEAMGRSACALYPTACQAHLMPEPLVALGILLAKECSSVALMDLSDGLARDLPRLLGRQENVRLSADIILTADMLHGDVLAFAEAELQTKLAQASPIKLALESIHARAIHHAFLGGEDYALVGTCSPADFDKLCERLANMPSAPTLHRIGVVTNGPMSLNGRPVHDAGFDHFS